MSDYITPELVAIGMQTIVLLIALIATVRHNERRITGIEKDVEHLVTAVKPIPGISRTVARLEGQMGNHDHQSS